MAWPRLSLALGTRSPLPLTPAAYRHTTAMRIFDHNIAKFDYEHPGKRMAAMMTTDLVAVNDKHCWSVSDWLM